jgi:hypothetical protein
VSSGCGETDLWFRGGGRELIREVNCGNVAGGA